MNTSLISHDQLAQFIQNLDSIAVLFRAPILLELGIYVALATLFAFFLVEANLVSAAIRKYQRVCLADIENPGGDSAKKDASHALEALKIHVAVAVATASALAMLLVVKAIAVG